MKKLSFMIAVLSAVFVSGLLSEAVAQTKEEVVTAEEKKAAQDIADRFTDRLDETGDVDIVAKELFISDFVERFIQEEKNGESVNTEKARNIHFVPWLSYKTEMLDQASVAEWRQLYVSLFNFSQYGLVVSSNKWSKDILNQREPEIDEKDAMKIYPQNVMGVLDAHPILRNLVIKKDSSNMIKSFSEFRSVNVTLAEAIRLLRLANKDKPLRLNPDSRKVQKLFAEKIRQELGPTLDVEDKAHFGFPAKTRFVYVWASVGVRIMITKVGNDYKIVEAVISSPD